MYTAFWIFIFLAFLFLYRLYVWKPFLQPCIAGGKKPLVLLAPELVMVFLLLGLGLMDLWEFYSEFILHYDCLGLCGEDQFPGSRTVDPCPNYGPEQCPQGVGKAPCVQYTSLNEVGQYVVSSPSGKPCPLVRDDVRLTPLLKAFALVTPPVVVVTVAVVLHGVWQHYSICGFDTGDFRDMALQVILLPLVYGLMGLKCVIRELIIFSGDFSFTKMIGRGLNTGSNYTYNERIEIDLYEANWEVADLYESWALYCFGVLCLSYLKCQKELRYHELKIKSPKGPAIRKNIVEFKDSVANSSLYRPLEGVTNLGVLCFVIVALIRSCMAIFKPLVVVFVGPAWDESFESWMGFMDGASFVASSVAIYNLIKIEVSLHDYLHEFSPTWKFWGTKILVSIAYMQSIIMSMIAPYIGLTNARSTAPSKTAKYNLLYSSLICMELLGIALLHQFAWKHDATWFHTDKQCFKEFSKKMEEAEKQLTNGAPIARSPSRKGGQGSKRFSASPARSPQRDSKYGSMKYSGSV